MKTLKEKIEVMQAALDGKDIEYTPHKDYWEIDPSPSFNWDRFNYRIKPEPMEFWVNVYEGGETDGELAIYLMETVAKDRGAQLGARKTIKVREVIDA